MAVLTHEVIKQETLTIAALYLRISKDRTGEALGVERQEALCREKAKARGWVVGPVFVDNDISAASGKHRPGYAALVEAMKAGEIAAIVTYHPDRLYRRMDDLEALVTVIEATGVMIETCTAGEIDLTNQTGIMTARIIGAVAAKEVGQTKERILAEQKARANAGKPPGGSRRFGYTQDWQIDEREAGPLREAVNRLFAGESARSICRDWQLQGLDTPKGFPMSPGGFTRMLKHPYLTGLRIHQGEIVGEGVWAPILDRKTWEQLQELLGRSDRRENPGLRGAPRKYHLSGLLTCDNCGCPLHSGVSSKVRKGKRVGTYRSWVCKKTPQYPNACNAVSVKAEPLEDYLTTRTLDLLTGSKRIREALQGKNAGKASEALVAVAELEQRLEDLADDYYAKKRIPRDEYQRHAQALELELSTAKATVEQLQRKDLVTGLPEDREALQAQWENSLDLRRKLTRLLFPEIRVLRAGRGVPFSPARLDVTEAR